MEEGINAIKRAIKVNIDMLLNTVLQQYSELFPDWEISTISIEKTRDRNEQLDRVINLIHKMKKLITSYSLAAAI